MKSEIDRLPTAVQDGASISTLLYTLSTAAHSLGNYAESYSSLSKANAIVRRKMPSTFLPDMRSKMTIMNDVWYNMMLEGGYSGVLRGHNNISPLFIVGLPHSGMEALERILAMSPTIFGLNTRDSYYKTIEDRVDYRFRDSLVGPLLDSLQNEIMALLQHADADSGSQTAVDTAAMSAKLSEIRTTIRGNMQQVVSFVLGIGGSVDRSHLIPGVQYMLDTELSNFLYIGLLANIFPDAAFVHIAREDPMDTLWDIYRQRGGPRSGPTAHFSSGYTSTTRNWSLDWADIVDYYTVYQDAMSYWQQKLPPGRLITVTYESLVPNLSLAYAESVCMTKDQGGNGVSWTKSRVNKAAAQSLFRALNVEISEPLFREHIIDSCVDTGSDDKTNTDEKLFGDTDHWYYPFPIGALLDAPGSWKKYAQFIPEEVIQSIPSAKR
jgi:Sulfotransferase family